MKQEQIMRMNKINELIKTIANIDRNFFNHNGEISYFLSGKKLFFIDSFTHEKIYPYNNSNWLGFCGGGTLRGLVQDFREWIITGKKTNGKNGYRGLYCTHWGYSIDGMDKIIVKAKEIGYLEETKPTFREICELAIKEGNSWILGCTIKEELDCE